MNPISANSLRFILPCAFLAVCGFLPSRAAQVELTDEQVMLQAIEATTPLPAESVPEVGTFWSAQNPDSAPLPENLHNVPAWNLGDGAFLMDDRQVDYEAAAQMSARGGMQMLETPYPEGGGDGDTNTFLVSFTPQLFTTNDLWLQMVSVTNGIANLTIHPPSRVTNGVYELLYCTNLTPPTAWQWMLRTYPGQTNLSVSKAADMQGFYKLGPPNDSTANDSLGTNFWIALCNLYAAGNTSLYISSPAGATGTVSFPGFIENDSILIVTNCGDAELNGTYVLTNLTPQQQLDWQNSGLNATDVGYVRGTNWAGFFSVDYSVLFGYDSGTGACNIWYYKSGTNLNGSDSDWYSFSDPNVPTPTTVCAQVVASRSFTVAEGGVTNVSRLPAAMMFDYDVVETNGIHITANRPVSVYGFNYFQYASAAFTAYPTPLLGTNYCVLARPALVAGGFSQLAMVATADDTTVTITPSPTANLDNHANAYTIILDQGETYQIKNRSDTPDSQTNDVTGTRVESDKPIAVFAGASEATVPNGSTWYANPLVQQQMPVDSWGEQALAVGFAGRMNGDSYRLLAANNNTVIWTNGVLAGTNQAGRFRDFIIAGPVEFRASQPVQVAHFANGVRFDNPPNDDGDPCEILLPPAGHYLMTNIVETGPSLDFSFNPPKGFGDNYLNLTVAQSAITNTLVDGLHISATNFVAIGTSGYYGAQVSVTNGVHQVSSSQPVGVEVYGFGVQDAYGYFGGIVK